jgi:hypothetical protein
MTFFALLDFPVRLISSNSSFIKLATSQPKYLSAVSRSQRCLFDFGIWAFIVLGRLLHNPF